MQWEGLGKKVRGAWMGHGAMQYPMRRSRGKKERKKERKETHFFLERDYSSRRMRWVFAKKIASAACIAIGFVAAIFFSSFLDWNVILE